MVGYFENSPKKYCSSHGELLDVRAALYLEDPEPQNQLRI